MTVLARSLLIVSLALCATNHVRAQQSSIVWFDDSEAGVAASQKSSLPMLFLILPSSDTPSTTADKSKEAFNDEAVRDLVNRRFVAIRLEHSATSNILLKRLNASDAPDGSVVIATPRGNPVYVIATNDVQEATLLAKKLAETFEKYQANVFANAIEPVISNADARGNDLLDALRLVKKLQLSQADNAVMKLLDRDKLPADVRSAAFNTLAALSTEKAVGKLLDAAGEDGKAAKALRLCTPAGAAALVPALKLDDQKQLALVYDALIAICSIDEAKPAAFWQDNDQTTQQAEIDRIKARVKTCVQASARIAGSQ